MSNYIRKKRKVCFLMGGDEFRIAGHHYSARDLGRTFNDAGHEVLFLMYAFGARPTAKAYSEEDNLLRVKLTFTNPASWRALRNELLRGSFDAIFCLDELSCRIALMLLPCSHGRIIPIKPGWINSDSWTASCSYLISFSRENFDYFKAHPRYQKTKLELLPNRVRSLVPKESLLEEFRSDIGLVKGERVLMASSRISLGDNRDPGKRPVFESAVALFNSLEMANHQWRLILIGTPIDEKAMKWIQELASQHEKIELVIDSKYTGTVSSLFPVADIVVAMGRTAMEALSSGCVAMAPVGERELPLPIISQTFETFAYYNFTSRAENFGDAVYAEADALIAEIKCNDDLLKKTKEECKSIFDKRLGTNSVLKSYERIIDEVMSLNPRIQLGIWLYSTIRVFAVLVITRLRKADWFRW